MTDYSKLKNSELESLLKERGLPHNGRKAEMVTRLQEADKAGEVSIDSAAASASAVEQSAAASSTNDPSKEKHTAEVATTTAASTTTPNVGKETEDAPKSNTDFSAGLASTSLDEEIARRKKRAEKFGMDEQESNAIRNLERQKRFGTGPEAATADSEGVTRLDEALPERRKGGGKRAREEGGVDSFDDPGLKRPRGGFRGRGRGRRGPRGGGNGTRSQGGPVSWMSEADKAAAEKRKAKFG